MKVVIRVDAARHIGTGHLHRCLTLAKELQRNNVIVKFAMIPFDTNLLQLVTSNGFEVIKLKLGVLDINTKDESSWLGKTEKEDAQDFIVATQEFQPDCCVVDHYALSSEWETVVSNFIDNIVVIDDLANRTHFCKLLIDQNHWPDYLTRYQKLIPTNCITLLGPQYCLLREEFLALREIVFQTKRKSEKLSILVNFGGISNIKLLKNFCDVASDFSEYDFTIITGLINQHEFNNLQQLIKYKKCEHIDLLKNTNNMAELMAKSNFAFGACGSTVWERFSLGLNAALVEVADNQKDLLEYLSSLDLIDNLGAATKLTQAEIHNFLFRLDLSNENYKARKKNIMQLVDGLGTHRVCNNILEIINAKR